MAPKRRLKEQRRLKRISHCHWHHLIKLPRLRNTLFKQLMRCINTLSVSKLLFVAVIEVLVASVTQTSQKDYPSINFGFYRKNDLLLFPSVIHIDKLLIHWKKQSTFFCKIYFLVMLRLLCLKCDVALKMYRDRRWCATRNTNHLFLFLDICRCWITAWCSLKLASFSCWF